MRIDVKRRIDMKVKELCGLVGGTILTRSGGENEIECGCVCDLLSWVMSRAKEGDAWLTVMGNINAELRVGYGADAYERDSCCVAS